MLRPTQSPIVFVQQLGRGLRKAENKEYVVVIDFIGNYRNNFMIPIALSGDRTYNKDNVRRYVNEGVRVIPGSSTVHFDEVSRKRIHELELLKRILKYRHGVIRMLSNSLKDNYNKELNKAGAENIINIMTNAFPTGSGANTYKKCVFIEKENNDYGVAKSFDKMLDNKDFYDILEELVDFGISRYERDYKNTYQDTDFVLYKKYTYEDACRLLNWENNLVPLNIGGYKYDEKTKTFPVFINYDKNDNISDTTKYEDHFVSENRLIAISKSGRTKESQDVQNFLNAKERGIDVQLFVRKNKDDKISKEFYYLGRMTATGNVKEFVMPNTDKTAVEIEWLLDTPVREDLYEYIVNN